MGSVLSSNQTKVSTYEDIYITMKLIQENNAIVNQIRGFILKLIEIQNINFNDDN